MDCNKMKINEKYIEINEGITCETDVLDIISMCISNDIKLVMLEETAFTEDFINLRTGLAGMVLQKLTNYYIKVAAVIEDKDKIQGRFKELVYELNKSSNFRVFHDINDAEIWISSIKG